MSKKKKEELIDTFYTNKPDADNIAKCILDPLNKLAYEDDSNVADLRSIKKYSNVDKTDVYIKEIDHKVRPAIHYLEGEN